MVLSFVPPGCLKKLLEMEIESLYKQLCFGFPFGFWFLSSKTGHNFAYKQECLRLVNKPALFVLDHSAYPQVTMRQQTKKKVSDHTKAHKQWTTKETKIVSVHAWSEIVQK